MIAAYMNKTPEEVALATTFNALKVKNDTILIMTKNIYLLMLIMLYVHNSDGVL